MGPTAYAKLQKTYDVASSRCGMEYRVSFRPKKQVTSTCLTYKKRPILWVPRGLAPWRGLGQSPKRTLRMPCGEGWGGAPKELCVHREGGTPYGAFCAAYFCMAKKDAQRKAYDARRSIIAAQIRAYPRCGDTPQRPAVFSCLIAKI